MIISDCYLYRNGETYALQLATQRSREVFSECSKDYKVVEESHLEEVLSLCDKHSLVVRYFV